MYRSTALSALGIDHRYGGKTSLDAVDAMAARRGERIQQEPEDQEEQAQ